MCAPQDRLSTDLYGALKQFGHKSDEYLAAFRALWESRFEYLKDWEIENIMESAKPHTQATKGLETMAWLYDRLMMLSIERENNRPGDETSK